MFIKGVMLLDIMSAVMTLLANVVRVIHDAGEIEVG